MNSFFYSIAKYTTGLINKYTLLSGGILGLFIPVISGVVSGNWLWITAVEKHEIFALDLLWLVLSTVSL